MAMNLPKHKAEKDKMAISYIEHISATTHGHIEAVGKRRSKSLVISKWESSPTGIDWRMIRSIREKASVGSFPEQTK